MGDITDIALERQLTEDARKRAATDPLPGPLAAAFLADAIKVTDTVAVRRVVASDWTILRGLKSPIIQQMLEMQKDVAIREEVPFSDEEGYEICWQFTHDPKASRALLASGRDKYRERAVEDIADLFDAATVEQIVKAVGQQIINAYETALKFGTEESEAEKKSPAVKPATKT